MVKQKTYRRFANAHDNNTNNNMHYGNIIVFCTRRDRRVWRQSFDRTPVVDVSEFPKISQCGRVVRLQTERVLVRPFRLVQLVIDVKYGAQIAVTRRVLQTAAPLGC
jgi:hypothetical protein